MDAFTLIAQRVLEKYKPAVSITTIELNPRPRDTTLESIMNERLWRPVYSGRMW